MTCPPHVTCIADSSLLNVSCTSMQVLIAAMSTVQDLASPFIHLSKPKMLQSLLDVVTVFMCQTGVSLQQMSSLTSPNAVRL